MLAGVFVWNAIPDYLCGISINTRWP